MRAGELIISNAPVVVGLAAVALGSIGAFLISKYADPPKGTSPAQYKSGGQQRSLLIQCTEAQKKSDPPKNIKTSRCKVIMIGELGVGKSALVRRYTQRDLKRPNTIEREERYKTISHLYYSGAMAAIIVYDITNYSSFERAKFWVKELEQKEGSPNMICLLAGNKLDMESQRAVTLEEALTYAKRHSLLFLETSAKSCTNVVEIFTQIAKRLPRSKEKAGM